jgi:multidrug resistance efflux pump/GAF domain-containing protein
MIPSPNDAVESLAASLLTAQDSQARASLIASAVIEVIPDSACILHRIMPDRPGSPWVAIGRAGAISIRQVSQPLPNRLLAPLIYGETEVYIYPSSDIRREDYAHVNVGRSVASISYLPLLDRDAVIGAVEIFSFSRELQLEDLNGLASIAGLASPALLSAEDTEEQRRNLLDSVHRMTQLYDLEKSLNATLDLDAVVALIPAKAAAMIACQAIHLWLFDGEVLRLMSSSGYDPTVSPSMVATVGEDYVADMAEEGEPLLISDSEDERLQRRNANINETDDVSGELLVRSALLVPLLQDDAEVGVLEAINKEGQPFDDDDLFFFSSMAETISSALKNASLMFAERKLEILEALVHVSSEITSTLRLDRLLQIIVNSPQNVLPFELCAIALDNRGRLQLKAVSGLSSLPYGDARVEQLNELVRWLSSQADSQHLRRTVESSEGEYLPVEVVRHFEVTGYRALYSLPLSDDQGRVGLLLYESSDPDFLDLPHTEMIKILAGQATVAIRNALLYREVPLISLLEPLVQRKRALLRTSGSRRLSLVGGLALAILFFVFCPLPMRVTGEAVVAPQHIVTVAAPVDGNVTEVFAHEGQRVAAGDVLGTMNDWQWRTDLASSEARYQEAMLVMQTDLAHGSPQSGTDRTQAEYLQAEVARARARLESAQLKSPITGVVITPSLQNAAGGHLDAGASFAQVLDLSSAVVNIAIPQSDAGLLRPGQSAAIKLDSYPQRSWHNSVAIVSPEAQQVDGEGTFAARVPLPNTDAILRAGMTGRAKIFIGYRPAGYVLLRRPALWIWASLWNWIGW